MGKSPADYVAALKAMHETTNEDEASAKALTGYILAVISEADVLLGHDLPATQMYARSMAAVFVPFVMWMGSERTGGAADRRAVVARLAGLMIEHAMAFSDRVYDGTEIEAHAKLAVLEPVMISCTKMALEQIAAARLESLAIITRGPPDENVRPTHVQTPAAWGI